MSSIIYFSIKSIKIFFLISHCCLYSCTIEKNVMTTAVIRSRYFNDRLKESPYYLIKGRKPHLSKMNIFDSFYAYKNLKKKLDPKCENGIFVGYDRNGVAVGADMMQK